MQVYFLGDKMESIRWPEDYLPGMTDNFASNEVIVEGLSVEDVWALLVNPHRWPEYYANASDIRFSNDNLKEGDVFFFRTFGFPVDAQVTECVPPGREACARFAWHGWCGLGTDRLDVIHAWLIEGLPHNRVRILTQESQKGEPAKVLAKTHPNPMVAGHQDWLEGIVCALRK